MPYPADLRIYTDPAKQRKWERISLRILCRERLGLKWRDWKERPR